MNLHEKSWAECLPYIQVVIFACEVCAGPLEIEPVHDPAELLPHIVCWLEGSVVDEVVITPLGVLHVLLEGGKHVQESQVVTVNVRKSQLGVVWGFLSFVGPLKHFCFMIFFSCEEAALEGQMSVSPSVRLHQNWNSPIWCYPFFNLYMCNVPTM